MRWIVNIEGKKDQRIGVIFNALNEEIVFVGQYKPHNKSWATFSEIKYSMTIDLMGIQECLVDVYDLMKKRLEAYNNIAEGFTVIKNIQMED